MTDGAGQLEEAGKVAVSDDPAAQGADDSAEEAAQHAADAMAYVLVGFDPAAGATGKAGTDGAGDAAAGGALTIGRLVKRPVGDEEVQLAKEHFDDGPPWPLSVIDAFIGELNRCKPDGSDGTDAPVTGDALGSEVPPPPALAEDQALAAAWTMGCQAEGAMHGLVDDPWQDYDPAASRIYREAARYIRAHQDASAEAVTIHLARKGLTDMEWASANRAARAFWETFRLSLIMLDAKLAAMQPVEPAKPLIGHVEPAELMADEPGDLTDQAVR